MNRHLIAFAVALGISFLITPLVRRLAVKLNVMVHPGGRRVHSRPMPLWGGLAIFVGFTIACIALMGFAGSKPNVQTQMLGVLVVGAFIVALGLLDDMKELSAITQALVITCAALLLMSFGVRIQFVTNPFGEPKFFHLPVFWSWFVTLVWMFVVTKTIDFMDGLDGLAAGIGAIASGVLGIMAYYSSQPHVALMSAALCGACIGFLRFNFNPAKIFMGTGGSQFIGFTLASISVIGAFKMAAAMAIALPILVLGVPIVDGLRVLVTRLVRRQPLHIADRSHLHHRLLEIGLTHKQAVIVIWVICVVIGIGALAWFLLGS